MNELERFGGIVEAGTRPLRSLTLGMVIAVRKGTLASTSRSISEMANRRLWRLLAARITPDQKARLDALLVVPEGGRQSPMDRLRSGPTLQSTAELARAIERLDDLRQLAAGPPRTDRLPKTRVLALVDYASVGCTSIACS